MHVFPKAWFALDVFLENVFFLVVKAQTILSAEVQKESDLELILTNQSL